MSDSVRSADEMTRMVLANVGYPASQQQIHEVMQKILTEWEAEIRANQDRITRETLHSVGGICKFCSTTSVFTFFGGIKSCLKCSATQPTQPEGK